MDQANLVFIISAPRSGSTMLQRMLGSHTEIMIHPEPHILTPIAFSGYYYKVDMARFNVRLAEMAIQDLVGNLPRGEDDYLDACRAYSDTMYERVLGITGKRVFVDVFKQGIIPLKRSNKLSFVVRIKYIVFVA